MPLVPAVSLACIVLVVAALVARRARRTRLRAMATLLDAADALEARLRQARVEIAAVAGDGPDPVRDAMQEMLRQRLWLKAHGANAPVSRLRAVQASIVAASDRIDGLLRQVTRSRTVASGLPR